MRLQQETVLIFHMKPEKCSVIRNLCSRLCIRVVEVKPEDELAPLGLLAGAADWMNPLLAGNARETQPLTEEMLVLAGFSDSRLDELLAALRAQKAQVSLKAVLTEQNAVWTAGGLQGELKQERAFFLKQKVSG